MSNKMLPGPLVFREEICEAGEHNHGVSFTDFPPNSLPELMEFGLVGSW